MTVAKALKTTSKVVFAPLLLTFLRISKSKPAIRPKRKRGKMLMSGFMKSMSKALVTTRWAAVSFRLCSASSSSMVACMMEAARAQGASASVVP